MSVKLTPEAQKDKQNLSDAEWDEIKSKIKTVTGKLTHKDLKLVPNPLLRHPVWQLTVDGENTDHRVYMDVDNTQIVVIAIWDFEYTHQGDNHWKQLEDRI